MSSPFPDAVFYEPEPGATTAAGDPLPVLVVHTPPLATPGDLVEDSSARPPLGDGIGPRLPSVTEDVRARYELGLDPAYSDTGTTDTPLEETP